MLLWSGFLALKGQALVVEGGNGMIGAVMPWHHTSIWRWRHPPFQQAESIRASFQWHAFLCPLAARGMNSDGRRLSLYSLSSGNTRSPAAAMSVPESGSTWTWQDPWCVHKSTFVVNPLIPILNNRRLDEIENPRLHRVKSHLMDYSFTAKWIKGKATMHQICYHATQSLTPSEMTPLLNLTTNINQN